MQSNVEVGINNIVGTEDASYLNLHDVLFVLLQCGG